MSRKHLTVTVDPVSDGSAYNTGSRSGIAIEDLNTKTGTFVNGSNIKGSKHVVKEESVELTIGKFTGKFRYALYNLTATNTSKDCLTVVACTGNPSSSLSPSRQKRCRPDPSRY